MLYDLAIEEPEEIDMEVIAARYGARICYERLAGVEATILGFKGSAIITVNSASPLTRQRYSIGHELGHWVFDRQTIGLRCSKKAMTPTWTHGTEIDVEHRANRYATDLLLPRTMFVPRARGRALTFEVTSELATAFKTSMTSTAMRLVELGSHSSILVCSTVDARSGALSRAWAYKSSDLPTSIHVAQKPGLGSLASRLKEVGEPLGPVSVCAAEWIEHRNAGTARIDESSWRMTQDKVLTLLSWREEHHLDSLLDEDTEAW